MRLNPIAADEFTELVAMAPVPCLVIKNTADDGLTIAAYQFVFPNGTAVLIQLPFALSLKVGDCVRMKKVDQRTELYPSTPLDPQGIADLENARMEFLKPDIPLAKDGQFRVALVKEAYFNSEELD